jgi:hypothetical protein
MQAAGCLAEPLGTRLNSSECCKHSPRGEYRSSISKNSGNRTKASYSLREASLCAYF